MGRAARLVSVLSGPLWAAAVVLASRSDAVVRSVPALGVLRGPVGLGLLIFGCGVAAFALLEGRTRPGLPGSRALFIVSAVAYVTLGTYYSRHLRVSGDEPHYLLMTESLLREHDLDLRDNFARGDYREFLDELPAPHYAAPRADGRPYPGHSPGLPALLAPAYAVGGRTGCVVLMALLGAWLVVETARLARQEAGDGDAALLGWAAALGPPVLFYAFHLYTEVPSALALLLALRMLSTPARPAGTAVAAVLASTLPWLHLKMAPAALALAVIALVRQRGAARVAFAVVAVAMGGVFLGYYAWVFGRPTPLAVYGGVPRDMSGNAGLALAGLALDRSYGLLACAPVFLLSAPGLLALVRRRAWPHLLIGASVVLPLVGWRMWWGGQCPPARFLVPVIPLLAAALAARVAETRRGLVRWRWALAGLGLALGLVMVARPEAMLLLNRRDRPTRVWDALSPEGFAIDRYLPSLVAPGPDERRVLALWCVALAALLALDRAAQTSDRIDRLFRGLGLPVVLALALGAGVDGWARPRARASAVATPDSVSATGAAASVPGAAA